MVHIVIVILSLGFGFRIGVNATATSCCAVRDTASEDGTDDISCLYGGFDGHCQVSAKKRLAKKNDKGRESLEPGSCRSHLHRKKLNRSYRCDCLLSETVVGGYFEVLGVIRSQLNHLIQREAIDEVMIPYGAFEALSQFLHHFIYKIFCRKMSRS